MNSHSIYIKNKLSMLILLFFIILFYTLSAISFTDYSYTISNHKSVGKSFLTFLSSMMPAASSTGSSSIHNWADTSEFDKSSQDIINAIHPADTIYFSSNGNDKNSGLDPKHPKKNPTDYLRIGNCNILLKSGDIFTLKYNTAIGSNISVSTYGGTKRAVINWAPLNSIPLQAYDTEEHIYYAPIDSLTDSHYKISWLKLEGCEDVDWHKVFSYSDLSDNMDFFSDKDQKVLYIKSDSDLSGKKFAFASNAGGMTIRDSSQCVIDNLEIVGGGTGIHIVNSSDVVIKNCFIHHVGGIEAISTIDGHFFRYGNGITVWSNDVHNIYISHNYVSDCFDAGISPQISGSGAKPSDSVYIYDNYIDRCLYCIEFYEHNREKTIPLTDIFIVNNILTNALDITDGYRYATYGHTSYFCTWSSYCEKTRFHVTNNIGYGTYDYAFAYLEDSPPGVNIITDNTLYVLGKKDVESCIRKYQYYTGSDSQIIPVSDASDTMMIKAAIADYTTDFDDENLYFSYMNTCLK